MRPDPITLTFGEQKFTIRPLTLGQIRDIEKELPKAEIGAFTEVALAVFAVALHRDHPTVNVEDLERPEPSVGDAFKSILKLGGFDVGAAPGEAEAAPTAETSGA